MASKKRTQEELDEALKSPAIVPSSFVEFCGKVCRIGLTDGQKCLWSVLADGALSGDFGNPGADIFGSTTVQGPCDVAAIVKGARIGGTLLGSLRLLHLALTVPVLDLATGEVASAIIVAPDQRLARQGLKYVIGAAKANLAQHIVAELADSIVIQRPGDGKHVEIVCLPATAGGRATRGRTTVGALLSEAAFFRDDSYKVNDKELYTSIMPRIVPGGQLILESTPWAESGLLYDLFSENFDSQEMRERRSNTRRDDDEIEIDDSAGGGRCIAALCPTLSMRDDARTRNVVARERRRDPENARREFDAEFMVAGSGLFFDPASVDACVNAQLIERMPNETTYFGADFGFVHDSSAIVGAVFRGEIVRVLCIDEHRPKRGAPLLPSATCKSFALTAKTQGATSIRADQHYAESVREHLAEHDVSLDPAPSGNDGKVRSYMHLKTLIDARKIELPRNPDLLRQLKSTIKRPDPGGHFRIEHPRQAYQGHGDLVSALVLAAWSAKSASNADFPTSVKAKYHT